MKSPPSHPSPCVGERDKPHHGAVFSSAFEDLDPAALHRAHQGLYPFINVAQQSRRFRRLTDGDEKVVDKVTSSDVDPVGVTARFALAADL